MRYGAEQFLAKPATVITVGHNGYAVAVLISNEITNKPCISSAVREVGVF